MLKVVIFSIEWNSLRLGDPADGIVTKTVHKTLPGSFCRLKVGFEQLFPVRSLADLQK